TSFRTLRAGEVSTTRELPNELLEARYTRRLYRSARLGEIWMGVDAMSLERPSATPSVGRDVSRVGVSLDWDNRWPLANGMVLSADAGLAVDQYVVGQDPAFGATSTQGAQKAALTLRWPMARGDAGGVRQLLEPLVQLSWTGVTGDPVPNEDSTVTEFDEGNLLAFSRFPGIDRYEEGLHANLGLSWTRIDPAGWSLNGTVGRIVRFDDKDQFAETSGLSGDISDWMVGLGLSLGQRLSLETRSVFDDGLTFSLSETRIGWQGDGSSLVGTYLWRDDIGADDVSEVTLESAYRFAPNWTGRFDWRYEADASRTTGAGLGLIYENECIGVDLSVSRRFTSSTSVEPATEFALRVSLTGFGTGSSPNVQARSCSG
ncbi:MAG: LPS-assembly protein LptD, partial [Alphaproteobacteria bacterium]|nr:LPS-assembly protein LptD [Alphaproteobacteria bacterium]